MLGLGAGCAPEVSPLPDQRAFLLQTCPRTSALICPGTGAAPNPPSSKTYTHDRESGPPSGPGDPAWTWDGDGSGLTALADWLDAPTETGAVRRTWQTSGTLALGDRPADRPAGCLVLIAGSFHPGPVTGQDDPDRLVWSCNPGAPGSAPTGSKDVPPDCQPTHALRWPAAWLGRFQLTAAPDLYAEIEVERAPDGQAIRLRPRLLEFGPRDQRPASAVPLHLSFYAAVTVDGQDLGVAAFGLPSRGPKVAALLPMTFNGHDGAWLPLPPSARQSPTRDGLVSVLAVLHQSAQSPDVDARLARILATARNAHARSVLTVKQPLEGH